jgi:hypothetical protein
MNFKTTLVLLVLVALGLGFWLVPGTGSWLALTPSKPTASPDAGTLDVLQDELTPDKLNRIEVSFGQEHLVLERGSGNEWSLPGKWPTRKPEVEELVRRLCDLRSRFAPIAIKDAPDLRNYGLDQPSVTVKVRAGETDYQLVLGDEPGETNRFSRATFLRLDDRPEVVRLAPGLVVALARPQDYYQQRRLFPADRVVKEGFGDTPEKVEQLTAKGIAAKDAATHFTLVQEAGDWELREPVHDRADPDKLKSVLIAVPDIWAEQFVDKPKKDLAEYGLKDPEQTLRVTRPSGAAVTLLVGKQSQMKTRTVMRPGPNMGGAPSPPQKETIHEEYRYAKLQDNDQVFEIKADKLKDIFVPADSLRDARLARFRAEDARRLEINQAGHDIVLVKDKDKWRLEKPITGEADAAKVSELLDKLTGLQARDKDILDKADAKAYGLDKPAATIKVTAEEEVKGPNEAKTKKTRTFTFHLGRQDPEKSKLYVQVAGWERVNAVEDGLLKLVQRPALAYRGRRVLDFNSTDVAKIEVSRNGQPFALEQVKGSWKLAAPVQADTDSSKAGQLAGDLGRLEAVEYIADNPVVDALDKTYGLAKPTLTAKVTFSDTKKPAQTLLIGKARTDKGEFFAKLASSPSVFVVKKETHDVLDQDSLAYRPLQLWQFPPEDITELRVRKDGPEYRLQRNSETWKIAGPFDATAVPSLVRPMTEELANLRCERYAAHSAKDLADYGLDKPYLRLAFARNEKDKAKPGQAAGQERVLLIGKPTDKASKSRFARVMGSDAVVVVGEKLVSAVDHDPLDLLDSDLLSLEPQTIERMHSSGASGPLTLERQASGWRVADTPAPPFPADSEIVTSVLGVWTNLRAQRIAAYGPQVNPATYGLDKPTTTVTVTVKPPTGNGKTAGKPVEHTLALGKAVEGRPGERYARLDNGQAVAILPADRVNDLTHGYLDFVNRSVAKLDAARVTSLGRRMGSDELTILKSDNGWRMQKPSDLRADGPTLDGLMGQLAALRAKRVAAFPAKDLAPFALEHPAAVVTVRMEFPNGKAAEMTLNLGKPTGDATAADDRFAMVDHSDTVVVLPGTLARQLMAAPLQFRDRNVALLGDVDRLILERGPRKAVFAKIDGAWKQTEPVSAETEQADLDEFLASAARLRADEWVAEKPADLKVFGLDRPQARWHFLVGDKEVLSLLVGTYEKPQQPSKEPAVPRCYAEVANTDLVFLLSPPLTSKVLGEFRKRAFWTPLDAAQIDGLTYGYTEHPFALQKKAENDWQVAGKTGVKVRPDAIRDVLDGLAGLKAERYVVDKEAEGKLYGLEPPQLKLEIDTRSGKRTLLIGRPEGQSKRYYARAPEGDNSAVFVIGEADAKRIVRSLAELTQPSP